MYKRIHTICTTESRILFLAEVIQGANNTARMVVNRRRGVPSPARGNMKRYYGGPQLIGPVVWIKPDIFHHLYPQYLVLLTMVPRKIVCSESLKSGHKVPPRFVFLRCHTASKHLEKRDLTRGSRSRVPAVLGCAASVLSPASRYDTTAIRPRGLGGCAAMLPCSPHWNPRIVIKDLVGSSEGTPLVLTACF